MRTAPCSFLLIHQPRTARKTSPMTPSPSTNQPGLIVVQKSKASAASVSNAGIGSTTEERPSLKVTPAMRTNETTFAPSRRPAITWEFLKRGMMGR